MSSEQCPISMFSGSWSAGLESGLVLVNKSQSRPQSECMLGGGGLEFLGIPTYHEGRDFTAMPRSHNEKKKEI
jgi:hypothetical protein